MRRDERAGLGGREDVLDDPAVLEPARVGPRQERDQQRRPTSCAVDSETA